ncbi:MAG: DUF190 domain-containing protein [Gammaproteobacteria bacterium]
MTEMVMVRVYILEAEKLMRPMLSYLHDAAKVRGVTVFRGITGFGKSGHEHSSGLLDISLNLPIVVEFFDEQARIDDIIKHLQTMVEVGHITFWPIHVA